MNLFSSIETHAQAYPDHTALVFCETRISYGQFRQAVDALSVGLRNMGVEKGDRIALFMPNCPEMIFSFYAAMKLGLINVSLNTMYQKDELEYILDDCQPALLIAHDRLMPLVETLDPITNNCIRVIQVGDGSMDARKADWDITPFSALIQAHGDDTCRTRRLDNDDEAVIAYTSGTTGFPKGAVHSHGNLLYHLEEMAKHLRIGPGDTILAALPFFQLPSFLIHPGLAVYAGATLVFMEKFTPQPFLDGIEKEAVTFFAGVPTIYQMLFDAAEDRHQALATVRFGICAGAPLSLKLRNAFENRMGLRIVHCYGSTETPLIAAFERPETLPEGVSVGPAAPHVPLRIVSPDGDVQASGEVGEIQIGAEHALKYYWNHPSATAEAIHDGWFSTGDVGRFDEDGNLHVLDRFKDMIIRGGFNVYPAEIERVLLQHPKIREAAVVGIPHERLGQVPKAWVVLEKDARLTVDDIIAFSREKLAAFKTIEAVDFVDETFFPRNAMGKIVKNNIERGTHED